MNTNRLQLIILLLGAVMVSGACIEEGDQQPGQEKIIILVSILPQADFVEQVGGDRVHVEVMIPPGANPATYEPSSSQLKAVNNARLYVKVGSGLPFEHVWLHRISSINPDMHIVDTSQEVSVIPGDPHIWLSPRSVMIQVENIYHGMIRADRHNKDYYYRNKMQYLSELEDLDREINTTLSGNKNRTFLVFHPSWGYFARDYNLTMIAVEIEGKEPSVGDVAQLIQTAREHNIKHIFVQPQFSTKSAEVIANEIGGEVVPLDPLAKDYIANMRLVSHTFAQGLS